MITALLLLVATADAGIALRHPPTPGEETLIEVRDDEDRPRPGETVRVVHRPGLQGERELAIGITDSRGTVRWTPQESGVARLRAGDETQAIRIPPAEPPGDVLALLAVLALAALGALGYGLAPSRRPTARSTRTTP